MIPHTFVSGSARITTQRFIYLLSFMGLISKYTAKRCHLWMSGNFSSWEMTK